MDLAQLTTLRLGGPAKSFVEATSEQQLIELVRGADGAGEPVLLVAGGSNLVVADEGFDGTVIKVATTGIDVDQDACSGATVKVAAGEAWDEFVARSVAEGWVGVEALSGIPGSVGATPIQNVGAYGQEVADTIASVRVLDRHDASVRTVMASDCEFSYRHSRFKSEPQRYVVLTVTFQFGLGDVSAPIEYAELARSLGVQLGDQAPSVAVRDAILKLRASKGMVLDANDHDTWSAGSFFTNPIVSPEVARSLPTDTPRFEQADGRVKISAAWLINAAGFGKGYPAAGGPARLSTKHALAVTNRGAATTADVLALAEHIRGGVQHAFGVNLVPEPVLVGCELKQRAPAD